MARHKDVTWNLPQQCQDWTQVQTAILMDIRDELKAMNQKLDVLRCSHFLAIPHTLQRIALNTAKPKRKRKS